MEVKAPDRGKEPKDFLWKSRDPLLLLVLKGLFVPNQTPVHMHGLAVHVQKGIRTEGAGALPRRHPLPEGFTGLCREGVARHESERSEQVGPIGRARESTPVGAGKAPRAPTDGRHR